jgi:RNA polymerase sigma-70 factor (ECF subfamily)
MTATLNEREQDPWITRITLLDRAKNPNDGRAWKEFVEYYESFIFVVIRKMNVSENDREDCAQKVLLKLWKSLPDFELDKTQAKFRTWLGSIIRNLVIDYFRSEKKHANNVSDEILETIANPSSAINAMIEKEWELHITKLALSQIESKFSAQAIRAFTMSLQGISIEDIAQELEIKENSAYKLRNRVKKYFISEIENLRNNLETNSRK